MIYD
jgi:hypothetical protein